MLNKINISPERQKLLIYVFLTVVIFAVFWQVNQYDFIGLDDQVYVTENLNIQSGITLDGFRWAFSTTYAEFWHPLTWLSLMFDYQLYRLNAGGYHLTNLILHIMSTLLLFGLFNRVTGSIWRSACVAGLFALHPLRVESVAWIAERKDVLSAFFWMLTLCLYVYYTEKPIIRRYLLVLFSFVCGLMSKSMVVTLPVVMILLDYWPLGRFESKKGNLILWQLREKIPFFIFSAIISMVTIYAQPRLPVKDWPLPLGSRIINAFVSFVIYLEKTFWPHDLTVFYPFYGQLPLWQVLGIASLILVISVAAILTMKRLPYLFVGWLWYSITLLPVIGIIPVGNNAMADRYIYLPSIGIAIMLVWGISSLIKNDDRRKMILFPVAIAFLAILSILTWKQCGYWKNSATLFRHALSLTKNNYIAHNGFANALVEEGKIGEAIDHFNKAIHIKPDYANSYNNRGMAYGNLGQYHRAIEDFNEAISIKPTYADAYYNRGITYAKFSQYQQAIEDYTKTININPTYLKAYNNRGITYVNLGQHQQAIEDFNKAISLKQDYADAYNNRGCVYFMQGNNERCCYDLQKACKLGNCKLLELLNGRGICR